METTPLMETKSNSPDARSCCNGPAAWKFPLLLLVVLAGIFFWKRSEPLTRPAGSFQASIDWVPAVRPNGDTVGLEVDFGNGARRVFDALPYHADMTVADVMDEARQFQPAIRYTQMGEGAGGFLTDLEGLKNEGASGRNWQYEVAGKPGNKSFCLQTVMPGEVVRWTFAGEESNR
jgi:hypothetical protein